MPSPHPEQWTPVVTVTPRRWWSRKDRKAARMAQRVLDHEAVTIRGVQRALIVKALGEGRWPSSDEVRQAVGRALENAR